MTADAGLAVRAVIENYVKATRSGDTQLLASLFHEKAQMFGRIGDRDVASPIAAYVDHASASAAGEAYEARIRSIEVVGATAVAVLEERSYQGQNFVDYFSLVQVAGAWKVVTKLFAVVR